MEKKPPEKEKDIESVSQIELKEIIEELPEETRRALKTLPEGQPEKIIGEVFQISQQITSFRSAPLPHPEELKSYDKLNPGFAKRFLDQFLILQNDEADHRRSMDKMYVTAEVEESKDRTSQKGIGMWLGFVIGISLIGVAVYCIFMGQAKIAGWILTACLASSMGVFLLGKYLDKESIGPESPP